MKYPYLDNLDEQIQNSSKEFRKFMANKGGGVSDKSEEQLEFFEITNCNIYKNLTMYRESQ